MSEDVLRHFGHTERPEGKLGRSALYSIPSDHTEYDKPITANDIEILRSIGRKSINEFTGADIEKAQKWAYKFYKELGTKSPFFRAWFGDWRGYDTARMNVVSNSRNKTLKNDREKNVDTGIVMSWNAHRLLGETTNHAVKDKISIEATYDIKQIVKDSVLLDTCVSLHTSESKMPNTAFMHSFYTVYKDGGNYHLLKLYAEQALSNNGKEIFTRAYQLKDIKK